MKYPTVPSSAVRPEGDLQEVVVLREADLDTDLPTAIARIRARVETARSRILIVGRESEERAAVEPTPPPANPAQLARIVEQDVLRAIGTRLSTVVGVLDLLLEEAVECVERADESAADGTRLRIQRGVREIGAVLDWAREAVADLHVEAERLGDGMRPCWVEPLLGDVAREAEIANPEVRVVVEPTLSPVVVPARAAELSEALHLSIGLTSRRIGEVGSIRIHAARTAERYARIELVGYGEAKDIAAPAAIARLREIVHRHGGNLAAAGPADGASGLAIVWPLL